MTIVADHARIVDGRVCQVSAERIEVAAARAAFGDRLVSNIYRGLVAEIIVGEALGTDWQWKGADWAAWNFEHRGGCKLEVKQSAARQSWSLKDAAPSRASFDISDRMGRLDGAQWIDGGSRRRYADVYVFAHHPIADGSADHRDPAQWVFYVAPTEDLPSQKTITLSRVAPIAQPCRLAALKSTVAVCLAGRFATAC